TIKTDVELAPDADLLAPREADKSQLLALFLDLEFKAWSDELLNDDEVAAEQPAVDKTWHTVLDRADFEAWLARLVEAELFAFDTETTSLDYMDADLVGVSFAVEPHEAVYVPLAHDYLGAPAQLDRQWVLDRLKPLLEDPNRPKVGQNLKYDMSVLARHGISLRGVAFDTMLESYVLDSTGSRHDMDSLALKYLGEKTIHFEDIAGKGAGQLRFNQIALEEAGPYAAEDADVTLRLHRALWPRVCEVPSLRAVFEDIEMPLVPVLSRIERNGARVDAALLKAQGKEIALRL